MRYLSSMTCCLILALAGLLSGRKAMAEDVRGAFPEAVYLLNNGIYFEAAGLLEKFIQTHPEHESAHLHLAKALYHLKRNTEAAHLAAEVLRMNPENADAKRLLTQLRIALGRELDSNDPEAILAYADLCKYTDSYGRAAAFYERYLSFRPADDDARLELARLLSWSGRFERSALHYQHYLAHHAEEQEVQIAYGRVLNSAGRFSDAIAVLEPCSAAAPERSDVLLDLARACWWSGQTDERIDLYRQALAIESTNLEDLNFQVAVARKLDWIDSEYALYERILALQPEDLRAAQNKSAYDDSQTMEALRLRKLLVEDPENPDLRGQLIQHFIAQERLGEALAEIQQLSKSDPVRLALGHEVEMLRRRVGQRTVALLRGAEKDVRTQGQEKIESCRRWLEANPDDQRTRSMLAYYLSEGEEVSDAAQQYRIILRTFPTVNPTISSRIKVLDALVEQKAEAR